MHEASAKPSKQFIKRGAIAVGALIIILIVQTNWFQHLFLKKKLSPTVVVPTTVGDILTKDSNQNGILDWEEKLWGLDPTVLYTNGISNKQLIEDKKKVLGINPVSSENQNETDKLAQQLYGLTAALGQSDTIDNTTLKEIAAKIGTSVETKSIINQYSLKDITTTTTTIANLQGYYRTMRAITARQKPVGDIEVLATALQNEDTSVLADLSASALAYKKIASELRSVPVPIGIAADHLQLMNSFAGIATSFVYMQQLKDNGVVALVGVATYKAYSDRLSTASADMTDYLSKYGILNP